MYSISLKRIVDNYLDTALWIHTIAAPDLFDADSIWVYMRLGRLHITWSPSYQQITYYPASGKIVPIGWPDFSYAGLLREMSVTMTRLQNEAIAAAQRITDDLLPMQHRTAMDLRWFIIHYGLEMANNTPLRYESHHEETVRQMVAHQLHYHTHSRFDPGVQALWDEIVTPRIREFHIHGCEFCIEHVASIIQMFE